VKPLPRAGYFVFLAAVLIGGPVALNSFMFPSSLWATRDLVAGGVTAFVAVALVARWSGAAKRRWQRLLMVMRRHALPLIVAALLFLWLVIYLAFDIFIPIKPGQGGVLWKRFAGGTVTTHYYGEGLHVIPPWDKMYLYDLRYQQQSKEFEVLSQDGLLYSVEVTVRYRLRPESLGLLHKCVGPNYVETLLMPEIGAVTRLVTAQLTPEQLYTSKRLASEAEIKKRLRLEVGQCVPRKERPGAAPAVAAAAGEKYLEVDDVFIRRVILPPKVADAVEAKLAQQQEMLEYNYRIAKERKEAERKAIEADGIKRFYEIVTQGLSPTVLQWRGIDATLELAKSPNSKTVIIGSHDKGGLPLVLGTLPTPEPPAPAPKKPEAEAAKAALPTAQ
jgi:prohibitin 2